MNKNKLKLESLKDSKFDAFKDNEISNLNGLKGGYLATDKTTYDVWYGGKIQRSGTDVWTHGNEATQEETHWDVKGDMVRQGMGQPEQFDDNFTIDYSL